MKTSPPHAVPSHSQIVHKTQDALIHHPGRTPSLEHLRHAPDHLKLAAFHMVHHDILFTRRWDITKVDYHRRCTVHGANFHSRKEFICRVRATALACLTRSSAPLRPQPSALSEPTNHRLQMTSWKCGSCPAMDAGGLALPRAEVAAGSRLPEYFDWMELVASVVLLSTAACATASISGT